MKGRKLEESDAEEAVAAYSNAASWFQDTIRLDETDLDARKNLEVVLTRIQLLNDQLNQGANSLEGRLERLLSNARTLLDDSRDLSIKIAGGDGADPSGQCSVFVLRHKLDLPIQFIRFTELHDEQGVITAK